MDWATLTPAIFSLLGVALGSAGSVSATYYGQRTSREQQKRELAKDLRDERKTAMLDYVRSVQDAWRFLEGVWGRRPLVAADGALLAEELLEQEAAQRMHELWYHQQKLALITNRAVHESAWRLNVRLQQAFYDRSSIDVGLYQFLEPAHTEFLETANMDLGSLAEP